jgi:hypothetical protein
MNISTTASGVCSNCNGEDVNGWPTPPTSDTLFVEDPEELECTGLGRSSGWTYTSGGGPCSSGSFEFSCANHSDDTCFSLNFNGLNPLCFFSGPANTGGSCNPLSVIFEWDLDAQAAFCVCFGTGQTDHWTIEITE